MTSLEGNAAREQLKQLAKLKQNELVTCPVCARAIKGKNLVLHYDREHAWERGSVLEHARGLDERAACNWLALTLLIMPLGIVIDTQLELGGLALWSGLAVGAIGITIFLLNLAYRISSSALAVRGDRLVLVRRFWLNSTLRLPVRSVSLGAMKDSSGGGDGDGDRDARDSPYRSWTDGSYLRIRARGGTLLVHCPHVGLSSQQLRWDRRSYQPGKTRHRRWSHIRLEREPSDALQRWLRDIGALRPASPREPAGALSSDLRR